MQGVKEHFGDVQAEIGTPGLLRKPMRGIVPSTLLRLWEGQCLHKAAPRQRGGPATPVSARQVRDFSRQGDVQPGKQRADLARQLCRELRKCSLFGDVQAEIDAWSGLVWQGSLEGVKEVQPFWGRPSRDRRLVWADLARQP